MPSWVEESMTLGSWPSAEATTWLMRPPPPMCWRAASRCPLPSRMASRITCASSGIVHISSSELKFVRALRSHLRLISVPPSYARESFTTLV